MYLLYLTTCIGLEAFLYIGLLPTKALAILAICAKQAKLLHNESVDVSAFPWFWKSKYT